MTDQDAVEPHNLPSPAAGTQLDELIESGREVFELFRDEQDRAFARTWNMGAGDAVRLPSREARHVLQRAYRDQHGRYPRPQAVTEAMDALAAEAVHEGDRHAVFLRTGHSKDGFVLDLADERGRSVDVSPGGWQIKPNTDVRFVRRGVAEPLPEPASATIGTVEPLRKFCNVADESDFRLVVAWLVMALRPRGPFPILILQGEQGSAKSTTSRVLKSLIDPAAAALRSAPKSLRDLAILAEGNWMIAIDNLSGVPTEFSDALCRLSTGGGFGTRALYTDDEERVFDQQRPVILNGIDAIATRQDLLDRSIVVRLPRLTTYREEVTFWRDFNKVRPVILSGLLNAAATALEGLPNVETSGNLRMADFVRWTTAAAPALRWPADEIVEAYKANHDSSLRMSLDGSAVARAVQKLAEGILIKESDGDGSWEGTPTQLLTALEGVTFLSDRGGRRWPANAQSLSRQLTLIAPALRQVGIDIESTTTGRGSAKERWITITPEGTQGTQGTHAP